jgi:hypothetical protein
MGNIFPSLLIVQETYGLLASTKAKTYWTSLEPLGGAVLGEKWYWVTFWITLGEQVFL